MAAQFVRNPLVKVKSLNGMRGLVPLESPSSILVLPIPMGLRNFAEEILLRCPQPLVGFKYPCNQTVPTASTQSAASALVGETIHEYWTA